jgi:hypothetical protein
MRALLLGIATLALSAGATLRLRSSRIRLRSGGTGHWGIDHHYRDARFGLHSATGGGVRVCHAADL